MHTPPSLHRRFAPFALVCALLGAVLTLFGPSSAQADAPGLSVTFAFTCDVSGTQPLAEWTITNNDLLAHDVAYLFKLDDQTASSSVDHLDAGQGVLTGTFPVPDGQNFMMYVTEDQQVIANSGEHIADVSFGGCFVPPLPPNPPSVSPTFEFSSECHPAGALFKVKATSNDGLEHKMQLLASTGDSSEPVDPAFWLIAGSPTAHSGVGIAPGAVAKIWVEENGTVLAESPTWQVDANEADCSADYADPTWGDSPEDEEDAVPPASDPEPVSDPAPAGDVEVQDATLEQSASGLPRTGVSHLTLQALTGTTLVLLGYALVRLGRRQII